MAYRVAIITLSDKGARGEREDKSGPLIAEMVTAAGYEIGGQYLLSDEQQPLEDLMIRICDEHEADLILTTGGTGFSQRDHAPQATVNVIDRNVPGIAQAMRINGLQFTPRSMLSRAVSGIRKYTLIINLPGSPKAVKENLEYILPVLEHGIAILAGDAVECGSQV